MFKLLIDLLKADEFYGVSNTVDIAKGLYDIPDNSKDAFKQLKRIVKSKVNKNE